MCHLRMACSVKAVLLPVFNPFFNILLTVFKPFFNIFQYSSSSAKSFKFSSSCLSLGPFFIYFLDLSSLLHLKHKYYKFVSYLFLSSIFFCCQVLLISFLPVSFFLLFLQVGLMFPLC